MIKLKKIRLAGHVAQIEAMRISYRNLIGIPKGNRPIVILKYDGRIKKAVRLHIKEAG
jgi:hypothetical protein